MLNTVLGYGTREWDGNVRFYRVKKKANPLGMIVGGIKINRITAMQFTRIQKAEGMVNLQSDVDGYFNMQEELQNKKVVSQPIPVVKEVKKKLSLWRRFINWIKGVFSGTNNRVCDGESEKEVKGEKD